MAGQAMPQYQRVGLTASGVSAQPLPNMNGISWHTAQIAKHFTQASRNIKQTVGALGALQKKEDARMTREGVNNAKIKLSETWAQLQQEYVGANATKLPSAAQEKFEQIKQDILASSELGEDAKKDLALSLDDLNTAQYGRAMEYTVGQLKDADSLSRQEGVDIAVDTLVDSAPNSILDLDTFVKDVKDNYSDRPHMIAETVDAGIIKKLEQDAYADPEGVSQFFKDNTEWFKENMGANYVGAQKAIKSAARAKQADTNAAYELQIKQRKVEELKANDESYASYSEGKLTMADIQNSNMSTKQKLAWEKVLTTKTDKAVKYVQDINFAAHYSRAMSGTLDRDALMMTMLEGKISPEDANKCISLNNSMSSAENKELGSSLTRASKFLDDMLTSTGSMAPKNPDDTANAAAAKEILIKAFRDAKSPEDKMKILDVSDPNSRVWQIYSSFVQSDTERLQQGLRNMTDSQLKQNITERKGRISGAVERVNGTTLIDGKSAADALEGWKP